ncbi:hypothetical protein Anas_13269, partial [Armadillidium nasatum]
MFAFALIHLKIGKVVNRFYKMEALLRLIAINVERKSIATYNEDDINCIRKWKPNGCDLYFYPPAEFKKCFKSISDEKFVVFVGDSRLRYIYNKFVWVSL